LNRTWFWPNGHGSFVLLKLLARVRIRDLLVDYLSKEHPGFRLDVPSGNETWQWKILSGKIIYKYPYYGCSIPMVVVVILPCFFYFLIPINSHQQATGVTLTPNWVGGHSGQKAPCSTWLGLSFSAESSS
jgi:hypothetical protein